MLSPAPTPPSTGTAGTGRKRARVDDEPEIEQMLQIASGQYGDSQVQFQSQELVRDDTYYMQDGSLVLQVENTLFNVSLSPCDKPSPG